MNKERILCLGGNGFLASCFKRNGYTVWDRSKFDYPSNTHQLELVLEDGVFDTVINCIGISDTRFCEDPKNWNLIKTVNGDLPTELSKICKRYGRKLVHISTGCIYSQRYGVCDENTFATAMCNYTVSKRCGELGCDFDMDLIIRPRLLFDSAKVVGKRNNLLQKFSQFNVFLNELNSISSLDTIVESIEALLTHNCVGAYNVCNTGNYTIYEMATHLGHSGTKIQQEALHASQNLFLVNNLMSVDKLIRDTGYVPRDTLEELTRCKNILDLS